jgi:hypothetical protein
MSGDKAKRATLAERTEAANAAFRAEVERLEALPMAQLAAEVMVRVFGPGTSGHPYLNSGIVGIFTPKDAYGKDINDLKRRLHHVLVEGLQVLEHQSLICIYHRDDISYAPTRRGQAALEAGAVEQALRGD